MQYQIVPHHHHHQQSNENMLENLPHVDMNLARFIHLMGEFLIDDDRDDIFKTVYYGDKNHYYHGEQHPDHPGFFHHYMVGGGMIMASQILGSICIAKEMHYSVKMSKTIDIDSIPLPKSNRQSHNSRVIQLPPSSVHVQQPQLPPPPKKTYQDFMAEINAI